MSEASLRKAILEPYDTAWPKLYMQAFKDLKPLFAHHLHSIHHVGSTAIFGIYAKPIIDILVVVYAIEAVGLLNEKMDALGYMARGEYGIPGRRYFQKGSKEVHTHHVHVYPLGHPEIRKNLIFRDYLNNYKDEAKHYSELKQALSKQYYNDVSRYTASKESYIKSIFTKITQDPIASSYDPLLDKVELHPYDSNWLQKAQGEIVLIQRHVPEGLVQDIQHIGSTAIPSISAKPLIDILIGVRSIKEGHLMVPYLKDLGYLFWEDNPNCDRMLFIKGMPPYGPKRTHQIHGAVYQGPIWEEKLLFRDFLRKNPKKAMDYEKLKKELVLFYAYDREAYTRLKGDFVRNCLSEASI